MEEELINIMRRSGFKDINISQYIMKNFSVNDWLENSGLTKRRQNKIFKMHTRGSDMFKKAYNMKITKDDCLIDVKNLILVGEKEV